MTRTCVTDIVGARFFVRKRHKLREPEAKAHLTASILYPGAADALFVVPAAAIEPQPDKVRKPRRPGFISLLKHWAQQQISAPTVPRTTAGISSRFMTITLTCNKDRLKAMG